MSVDFMLSKYRELCQAILAAEYSVWPIARYMAAQEFPNRVVLLRHDIDRLVGHALQMARLEHELGLQATYYARMSNSVFQPTILKEIVAMGHELGYHYETLSKAKGDISKAIALFEQELSRFQEICDIQTISMHGTPLSSYDNRDLWQHYDFRRYGLLGEAFLSLDYEQLAYLTDTGRSWADNAYNIRDKVAGGESVSGLITTDDLILALRDYQFTHICISAHPERWAQSTSQWVVSATLDFMANQVKRGIMFMR